MKKEKQTAAAAKKNAGDGLICGAPAGAQSASKKEASPASPAPTWAKYADSRLKQFVWR